MYDPDDLEHRACAVAVFREWDHSHEGASELLFLNNGGRSKLDLLTGFGQPGTTKRLAPVMHRAFVAETIAAAHAYAKTVFGRRADWPVRFTISRPDPALIWLLVHCSSCPSGHYRPRQGRFDGVWVCRCGHAVTCPDLDGGTGDRFRTDGGALQRGTPETAEYRMGHPSDDRDRLLSSPEVLALPELLRSLREYRSWSSEEISRTLGYVNTRGVYEHVSGYGLRTHIRRLA
ncbi:hypothetical protein [Streptomyces sp. TR02-1]|uniref:hypothetical protein n=1 Tax=Streptomyces sp. TR02-1 TaxID=3385977 RepID=UPI0039A3B007